MTAADLDQARQALTQERNGLIHQLGELGADEAGELTGDIDFGDAFADAGAATAERTEVLGLIDALKQQLDTVDAALKKVEDGTYGVCVSCGNQISPERLEFRPNSIRCVSCKQSAA
jgi:DnaK suppressor protein